MLQQHVQPSAPTWENDQKVRTKPLPNLARASTDLLELQHAAAKPEQAGAGGILKLQRTVGNRETAGLIQRGRAGGAALLPSTVSHLVPQQDAAEEEVILTPRPLPSVQQAPLSRENHLQRQGEEDEDIYEGSALKMRKVTGGSLEGGKKVSDYYPDLVGRQVWGGDTSAGPFDNGVRAGSVVQLIGEIPEGADPTDYTFQQSIGIVRFRKDGEVHPDEGVTLDDIARSGRDQSTTPFRQVWDNKVSMCDPISGIAYSTVQDYDFAAAATTSITHKDGETASVDWSVTIKSEDGKVTENTVS